MAATEFTVKLVVHVKNPEWRAALDAQLDELSRAFSPLGLFESVCRFVVVDLPDRRQLANFMMDFVHRPGREPLILLSDQIYEGGISRVGKVVRSLCWSHGRLSTLISLDEKAEESSQAFLTHCDFSTRNVPHLRGLIEHAATRLHLMGTPEETRSPEEIQIDANFDLRLVDSRELLERCFQLRHTVYQYLGVFRYLGPVIVDKQSGGNLDIDYHDGMSIHLAAIRRDTGELAGTTRVVMPHRVVNELMAVRGQLRSALDDQRHWFREVVGETGNNDLIRQLEDPGCAPLPMLKNVRADQVWGPLLRKASEGAELSRFIVHPKYRGRGVSKALGHYALANALELRRKLLFLQCIPNQTDMYTRLGFREIVERSGSVSAETMELLVDSMVCDLDVPNRLTDALRWDAELLDLVNEDQDSLGKNLLSSLAPPPEEADVTIPSAPLFEEEHVADAAEELSLEPRSIGYRVDPAFESGAPSYILDVNFRFVDWNPAFQRLFAHPFGLRRGMHATIFLTYFDNCEEVMAHSVKVFAPGKHPINDTETLKIRTEEYGVVTVEKLASQLFDADGFKAAWSVTLNVLDWEKKELPLIEDMMEAIDSEIRRGLAAVRSNDLLAEFEPLNEVVDRLVAAVDGARHCLLLGTRSGLVAATMLNRFPALRLTIHESNVMASRAIEHSLRNCRAVESRVRFVKAEADTLDIYPSQEFDCVIDLWGTEPALWETQEAELSRVMAASGRCIRVIPRSSEVTEAICSRAVERDGEEDALLAQVMTEGCERTIGQEVAKSAWAVTEDVLVTVESLGHGLFAFVTAAKAVERDEVEEAELASCAGGCAHEHGQVELAEPALVTPVAEEPPPLAAEETPAPLAVGSEAIPPLPEAQMARQSVEMAPREPAPPAAREPSIEILSVHDAETRPTAQRVYADSPPPPSPTSEPTDGAVSRAIRLAERYATRRKSAGNLHRRPPRRARRRG